VGAGTGDVNMSDPYGLNQAGFDVGSQMSTASPGGGSTGDAMGGSLDIGISTVPGLSADVKSLMTGNIDVRQLASGGI
jgi:hypothetical protein